MKEFLSIAKKNQDQNLQIPQFLTKPNDMELILHDKKLSQTFQSLLCNIYLFYHYEGGKLVNINLDTISRLYQESLKLMMNSPETKGLLVDFSVSDWIKDIFYMLDILKSIKFYISKAKSIQATDIALGFTTEESLYFDKLLQQFQDSAKQVPY